MALNESQVARRVKCSIDSKKSSATNGEDSKARSAGRCQRRFPRQTHAILLRTKGHCTMYIYTVGAAIALDQIWAGWPIHSNIRKEMWQNGTEVTTIPSEVASSCNAN